MGPAIDRHNEIRASSSIYKREKRVKVHTHAIHFAIISIISALVIFNIILPIEELFQSLVVDNLY